MKIGYLFFGKNRILKPGDPERLYWGVFGAGNDSIFRSLYPEHEFVELDTNDPDFDLANQMDVIIHLSCKDECYIKYAHKIIPPKVFLNHFGYNNMYRGDLDAVMNNKFAMDCSDIIWVADKRKVPLYRRWVKKPLFYSPLPYPSDLSQYNLLHEYSDLEIFDIIIAYGISASVTHERNGFVGCKAAQDIICQNIGFSNFGVFNWHNRNDDIHKHKEFLATMGCYDFTLIPSLDFAKALYLIRNAKLCINLDCWEGAGKIALDCAVCKTPHISSDRVPYARELYPESWLVHPFDIDAVVERAYAISNGCYNQTIIESAYNKAKQFDMKLFAQKFEDLIKNFPYKNGEVISFM